jgi:succinoglycan biosynthesis protein ExoA
MHPANLDLPALTPAPALEPASILAIIPALNEERHIEACIRSLMTGDARLLSVPLIVADGGSTDRTVEIVQNLATEFPNLRVVHNPKKLQSAALNLAVETGASPETQWIIRCDAHSIYPDRFILTVAEALKETGAQSVVIPMDAVGESCFEKANAWIVDTPLGSGGSAHRGGTKSAYVDHGHHAGFEITAYRAIGGYDETFSHNEDAEYDARLAANGGKIWLDANIRIQYIPRGSVAGLARQYFNYGKGRARNAAKHNSPLKLRQTLPIIALALNLIGLLAAPLFWPALILPFGYLGVLGLASLYVAYKHRSACGLLAGLALGAMHMSWAAGFLRQSILSR